MRKGIIYVYFNKAKYEKEGVEKYYVGQTIGTMEERARKDGRGYGWNDLNYNSKFARSIRKWGWNSFEGRVLEEVDEEDLNELEKFYIEYFDSFKNGYNSTLGGEGTRGLNPYANKTEEEMEEIKEKMSKSQSIGQRKRYKNPKEREKQSIGQKKRFQDPKEKEKQSIIQKKHWKDKEYRKKQNIAQKKRWKNIEEREKISGEKNGNAKSVYCNTLNIVFSYIGLTEKYCKNVLNSKIGSISDICNGKGRYSGEYNGTKLTWSWTKNLDKETLNNAEYIDDKKYEEIINERKKCSTSYKLNYYETSVYCNELNIIFSYIALAERYCINILNSKIGKIKNICNGKGKYSGEYNGIKLTWCWTKNLDKETLNNAEYIDNKKYEEIINERKKCGIPHKLNYYSTSVYCEELNIVFLYTKLAEKYCIDVLNIKIGPIRDVCNGKRKSTGAYNEKKLHWSWTKNLDKKTLNNAEYIDNKKYEEIINAK